MVCLPCAAGKKINWVEAQATGALASASDQAAPFAGAFGCPDLTSPAAVRELGAEGWQGTLFRLPLRTEAQAANSAISKQVQNKHCPAWWSFSFT